MASRLQNGTSWSTKCAIKDGFHRDSHNLTYMLDEMVGICVEVFVEVLQEELECEVFWWSEEHYLFESFPMSL